VTMPPLSPPNRLLSGLPCANAGVMNMVPPVRLSDAPALRI
jgi:hypothetical protein